VIGWLVTTETKEHTKLLPIKIHIADDHNIFRDGLRLLLESEPHFIVVGESSDGDETLKAMARSTPDVLLLDANMPTCHGLQVLKELSTSRTNVRTILLTAEIEKQQIVEGLLLGAMGVVIKDSTPSLLFKAIRTVVSGQYWIGRDSVNDIIRMLRDLRTSLRKDQLKHKFGLKPRELEIISALVAGDTNKDIARRLFLSEQAVKHHLTNIFNKVGVSQRVELALFAMKHNLINHETCEPEPERFPSVV
jgi:two-component system nitrate/nitrite response regulator NarL